MTTVLIVDDDEDIRDTLCDVLELLGYEAIAAANGREALDKLAILGQPCLILLDLMMPVMSGQEFLAARGEDERLRNVPVVVVTASGTISVPGVAEVLHKPLSYDVIHSTVSKYC